MPFRFNEAVYLHLTLSTRCRLDLMRLSTYIVDFACTDGVTVDANYLVPDLQIHNVTFSTRCHLDLMRLSTYIVTLSTRQTDRQNEAEYLGSDVGY